MCERNHVYVLEDEYHFIMYCPTYCELRQKYIDNYHLHHPTYDSFVQLMSNEDENIIRKFAIYVQLAIMIRLKIIESIN